MPSAMDQNFTIERVSRPISKALRSEIEAMWKAENARIADPEARMAQVGYIARHESGALVGVCSSVVEKGVYNGLQFHAMRVLVSSAYRQNLLAFDMLAHLSEELSDNSEGDIQGGPVGVKVVIQTPIIAQRGAIPCTRTFQFPVNKSPKTYLLSGFTPNAHPEYCCYFENDNDASRAALERWAHESETFCREATVQLLTQDSPAGDKDSVLALLQEKSITGIPARSQPAPGDRILYSLRSDSQVIAACELVPRVIPEINGTLLGLHIHAGKVADNIDLATCFARQIYTRLNQGIRPRPAGAAGLFTVYTDRTGLPAVCPVTGFHLHGVDTQGRELRVRFFDDVVVKVPA